MEKTKLLVSFSGGETSAYMAWWLKTFKLDEYEMVFVFANTGQEDERTLQFVHRCDIEFNLNLVWVEAITHHGIRKGCTHKIVDFNSASRNGKPFEEMIKKYGIPNKAAPHCTRELKKNPIDSFGKEYFGNTDFLTAIGIRSDEIDRVNSKFKELKLYYPLASDRPMTKPKINFWWQNKGFRLQLKGYEGNCMTCWKKSDKKLYTIAKEHPERFDFFNSMENKYPRIGAEFLKEKEIGVQFGDRVFFRGNRSSQDIISESKTFEGIVLDDSEVYDNTESCDIHSNCGDL